MGLNLVASILCGCTCLACSGLAAQEPPVDPNNTGGSSIQIQTLSRSDLAALLSKGPKIAYLVGISEYDPEGTGFPRLQYPIKDVTQLDRVLRQQGYTVVRRLDSEATASRIRGDLKNYATGLASSDGTGSFLFYYSGHGYAVNGKNYLATYGTQAQALDSQGLAVAEVSELLEDINVREQVAMIDACRDDPEKAKGVAAAPQSIAEFNPAGHTAFLFSTKKGQVSREDEQLGQGVFTYYLLAGLSGAAAEKDGLISWNDLKKYVEDRMSERSLDSGKFQIPFDVQGAPGDFAIGRALSVPPPAPVARVARPRVPNQVIRVADLSAPLAGTHLPAISADAQLVAAANETGVGVWNVATGAKVAELTGPVKPVRCLALSPDSKLVAAGAEDQSLWIWEIATSTGWQLRDKGLKVVNAISFSADREFLATASTDKSVRVWSVRERQLVARTPESSPVSGIVFRPDPKSTSIAWFGPGSAVRVWNWTAPQNGGDFAASGKVTSLNFSPDGTHLAVGSDNGTIEIRDVTRSGPPAVLTGHAAAVAFVAFSRDGSTLASTSPDRTFRSWNIQDASETKSTETKPGMEVVSLSFMVDGRLVALAFRGGYLELWEVPSP